MKTTLIFLVTLLLLSQQSYAQYYHNQYFDGADTNANNSIIIVLDTSSQNIWQVGPPQKTLFHTASTQPNVIVTDTVNYYPINNTSSFTLGVNPSSYGQGGFLSLQWIQKLDLDDTLDGGYVEYSIDTGATWTNVFNDPFVYNFYGYNPNNKDTLSNGDVVFSGKDTNWRDVWLCFDFSWLSLSDTLTFRFTLKSDSVDNNKEGWMIDNMNLHPTWFHTINETDQKEYMKISPNPSTGLINITSKKIEEFHIIEELTVFNLQGQLMKTYTMVPTKFTIDLRDLPKGAYIIKVKTNLQTETFRVILQSDR